MTDFLDFEAKRIRRLILEALAAQDSGSWTGEMIELHLKTLGYYKSPDYLRVQFEWLSRDALAVKVVPVGGDVAVKLRAAGRRHVEGVALIPGVHAPADES